MLRNMYVSAHIHTHAITTNEKRGHKFQEGNEKYGRVWRDKRKGENIVIVVSKNVFKASSSAASECFPFGLLEPTKFNEFLGSFSEWLLGTILPSSSLCPHHYRQEALKGHVFYATSRLSLSIHRAQRDQIKRL